MSDELLDRVRAVDPLPEGSTPPPFDSVFEALTDGPGHQRRRGRRGRRRFLSVLAPAVSVGVAVGVLIVAVTLLHAGRRAGHHRVATTGHRSARIPSGGMPGYLTVWGAGFSSGGDGVISLEQCLRCGKNGNWSNRSTFRDWLLTTRDGGRTWTRSKHDYYLQHPVLAGQGGWAGGLQMLSRRQWTGPAKWEPGVGIARYYVTHDGGRSWSVAPSAAPNEGGSSASVSGGGAWAVGLTTKLAVLHSSVQGATLRATPSQPITGDYTNVRVEAAGPNSAYVVNGDVPRQSFVTHDDGRTWERLTLPPCTGENVFAGLDAAFGQSVWLTCQSSSGRAMLVRSLDGGRTWQRVSFANPEQMVASSPTVAWALSARGKLFRTTNAGDTWQRVWSATNAKDSPLSRPVGLSPSPLPILSVQSADSASLVTLLNRRRTKREAKLTDLVVYRTINGGQSWQAYPVAL